MNNNEFYKQFIDSLNEKGQFALSLHFQHKMMLEQFAKSKEMQKMKDDITKDVLNSIDISIENRIRKVLDDIFKDLNI